jgi:3-oxoacyl-(acyl-carrier-protein) synthase
MKAHTGNFLDDVDKFDNEFFSISPREARRMDPQMRILLHAAYEALEDSGYVPNASPSFNPDTFGCYVGAATGDYALNLRHDIDVYYSTGKSHPYSYSQGILAATNRDSTRLPQWSYFVRYGFRRPVSSCGHSLLIVLGGYLPGVPRTIEWRLHRRPGWWGQRNN